MRRFGTAIAIINSERTRFCKKREIIGQENKRNERREFKRENQSQSTHTTVGQCFFNRRFTNAATEENK